MKKSTYTSNKGIEITITPVNQFRVNLLSTKKKQAPAPTYDVQTVTGNQTLFMDEKAAEELGRMDEYKEYAKKQAEYDQDFNNKFLNLILFEGVICDVPDEKSEWQQIQDELGMEVPTGKVARKVHYILYELLAGTEDTKGLSMAIMNISGAPKEEVKNVENSFRDDLQGNENSGLPQGQESVGNDKRN